MWSTPPVLVARDPERGPARLRLSPGELRVGRDPGNDLVLPDATVSRRHALLTWSGDLLAVEDLSSSGGCYVNGTRIQRCELCPGDTVRFGPLAEYEVVAEVAPMTTSLDLTQLRRREEAGELRELQSLLDVARALNAATVLDEVLQVVLEAAVRLLGGARGLLVLRDGEGRTEAIHAHPAGRTVVLGGELGALLERAVGDRRTVSGEVEGRQLLATPLLVARRPLGSGLEASFIARVEVLGGLVVERPAGGNRFAREATGVIESLAADAATAIDSARLYREARDKAKIEHEMGLARTIQAALLSRPPEVPFAETFAFSQAARSVGGDLYHAAVRPDGDLAFALGDVSGKGMSAALLMAVAQGLLGVLHDLGQPLAELLSVLDRNLRAKNPGNRFLTLATGALASDGRLLLANAGHCPVCLARGGGEVELVGPTGPLLGLLPAARWTVEERRLAPGEAVVLYSDGISESESPAGAELEVAGVKVALAGAAALPAATTGQRLLDAAARHREGREPGDDVTVLVVRYR